MTLRVLFLIALTNPGALSQDSVNEVDDAIVGYWVEQVINRDARVGSADIKTTCENGVVTLRGEVPSAAAIQHAVSLARRVHGVRAVDSELRVTTDVRKDATLLSEVQQRISASTVMRKKPIQIDVKQGVVTLSGTVDYHGQRREATWLARQVRGVRSVVDKIKVEPVDPQQDSAIRREILSALQRDSYLAGLPLDVSVADSEVKLVGDVPSAWHRSRAIALVLSLKSVSDVVDEISVDPTLSVKDLPAFPNDETLAKSVSDTLEGDARIVLKNLVVTSIDGQVTIRGTTSTFFEKRLATESARSVRGVFGVANLIEIDGTIRDDKSIIEDIRAALDSDAVAARQDIGVRSAQGVVTLSGSVDSAYVIDRARQLAVRTRGVRGIRNEIKLDSLHTAITDRSIERQIQSELKLNFATRYAAAAIGVRSRSGVVTLTGDVARLSTRREAGRIALSVAGVVTVVNEMKVGGQTLPTETTNRRDSGLVDPPRFERGDFIERDEVKRTG